MEEQEMVERFLAGLHSQSTSVGVWGAGAIGSSAAYYFARVGLRCVAYDVSEERVREIRAGQFQSTSTHTDSIADPGEELAVTATTRWRDLEKESVAIHLVSVPTERAAEPSAAAFEDVMPQIAKVIKRSKPAATPPVVSIESTILPHWIDTVVIPALRAEGLNPDRMSSLARLPGVTGSTARITPSRPFLESSVDAMSRRRRYSLRFTRWCVEQCNPRWTRSMPPSLK